MGTEQIQNWANISEIVGAVAVVASLIYLAIQIRQSNALARAGTRQVMMQMGQNELGKVVDDPSMWDLFTKNELTRPEKIRLHSMLLANLRQRDFEWAEQQEGTIDPKIAASYAGILTLVLGTERTRKWWDVHGHSHTFDGAFVDFVDRLLEKAPITDYWDSLDRW